MSKKKLVIALGLALGGVAPLGWAGTPVTCVSTGVNTCVYTYDAANNYSTNIDNFTTTITFNDWGYTGPTGVGVNDFQVGTGFDAGINGSNIGQMQTVTTLDPDWMTSDPAMDVVKDPNPPSTLGGTKTTFTNASMDATVNFYAWSYTTVGGSTFTDMEIDKAGNYFVAKENMSFQFYDMFSYNDVTTPALPDNLSTTPDRVNDTSINFKPYAVSDAQGWCGSVLTSDPNALEQMAGQVTFDIAFDVYLLDGAQSLSGGGTQLIPAFVMRSYGDYTVQSEIFGDPDTVAALTFQGSAVGNNTNPESVVQGVGGTLDPAYQNKVSFLGAGVIPLGAWVTASSYISPGVKKLNPDGTWDVTLVDLPNVSQTCDPQAPGAAPEAGAVCFQNGFAGYPFLMRADGSRVVTYINPTGFSNYSVATTVPVPGAVWLLGSGLVGLGASTLRRRRQSVQ